jgi:hypothetical protein
MIKFNIIVNFIGHFQSDAGTLCYLFVILTDYSVFVDTSIFSY